MVYLLWIEVCLVLQTCTFVANQVQLKSKPVTICITRPFGRFLPECSRNSRSIFGFALLRLVIGCKNSRHFLSQSEVKPKPIVTRWCTFSRASSQLPVFARVLIGSLNMIVGALCDWPELSLWILVLRHSISIDNCSILAGSQSNWLV